MKFSIDKALEILERTPDVLISLLQDLSEDWTHCNEAGESWSAYDVVGHLIHGEKTDWITRTEIILSDAKEKTFASFDRFAQFEASKGKSMSQLLAEFKDLRQHSLERLKAFNISESDLDEQAAHPELGPVTMRQLLATWVTHDLGHIAQITRVMAKQYKDEVGPWSAYIPIVNN